MARTRTESTARKKIIAAINKLVPQLASPDAEVRMAARYALDGLQAAEALLSRLGAPAPAPALAPEAV